MPAKTTRSRLTSERIFRAALTLADRHGIEAVTMRRVARALGVEAMSLYNHVANKDALLDGITDMVAREIELPVPGRPWDDALRASALSGHEALLQHPWACSLMIAPERDVPTRIQHMEAVLACLREAGFSPAVTYHAYHVLDAHVLGYTLWEVGHTAGGADLTTMAADFLEQLPEGRLPYLAEHIRQHLPGGSPDGRSGFEFGLDLIIDGLRRQRGRKAR